MALRVLSRARLGVLAVLALVLIGAVLPTGPTAHAAARAHHTREVVVRPVTAAGRPAQGWTVHHQAGPADCWGQSLSAVDAGIDICGPAALYLPSCWKSRHHSVLCLRSVEGDKLVRVHRHGSFPVGAVVDQPRPQGLRLTNGLRCKIRIGGAWGPAPGHPHWAGFYFCNHGDIYGPETGDGLNRSRPMWRVHLVREDGSIVTRKVARATYVGNAA